MIHPASPPPPAPEGTAPHRYHGKYPALVVDRVPATSGSHHRGELKVRVPGILEEGPGGEERPLEAVARPCFVPGLFWVPEVGDGVWVEFAAGELDDPIWTGVWYAEGVTPATVDGDRPTEDQKILRTPSGQLLQMEDSSGSERTVLADEANGNRVVLDANGILLEAGNCTIELTSTTIRLSNGQHTLEMDATGTRITDATGGGPHPAVLDPVLQWLLSHKHMGNMGAPTPVFPDDLATLLPHDLAGTGKSGL